LRASGSSSNALQSPSWPEGQCQVPGPVAFLARRPGRFLEPRGGTQPRGVLLRCTTARLPEQHPPVVGSGCRRSGPRPNTTCGRLKPLRRQEAAPADGEPSGPLGRRPATYPKEYSRPGFAIGASSQTDPKVRGSSKTPDRDRSRSPSFLAHSSVALSRRKQAPVVDGAEPLRRPPTRSGLRRGPGRRTTTTSFRQRTRPGRPGWRKQASVGSCAGPLEAAGHKDRPQRRRNPRAQQHLRTGYGTRPVTPSGRRQASTCVAPGRSRPPGRDPLAMKAVSVRLAVGGTWPWRASSPPPGTGPFRAAGPKPLSLEGRTGAT